MKLSSSRFETTFLDPTPSSERERDQLARFLAALDQPRHPALVDAQGHQTELPEHIYQLLLRVKRMIEQNQVITLVPQQQKLTTQAAANLLGVSRPHLVALLKAGQIPYTFTGKHRRVAINDLLEYMTKRDNERREVLNRITEAVDPRAAPEALQFSEAVLQLGG